MSKDQTGVAHSPSVANQIPIIRPVQQRLENMRTYQDTYQDETFYNNRIASERFGNALPPNHPYLQVSPSHDHFWFPEPFLYSWFEPNW